jgi:diguanylate cyclase (GGDEF)-like protein
MRSSFRARVLLIFLGFIVVAQGITSIGVLNATYRNSVQRTVRDLEAGGRVLDDFLRARGSQLASSVRLLAADYAFKEAVATGDAETIDSVLKNHGARIGADLVMLLSLNGDIVASTGSNSGQKSPRRFPLPELLHPSRDESALNSAFLVDGDAYQVVVAPVRAPQPIGWLTMGFRVDRRLAENFRSLTGLELTILTRRDGVPKVATSTLPDDAQRSNRLTDSAIGEGEAFATLGSTQYLSGLHRLEGGNSAEVTAVVHKTATAALASYESLKIRLLGWSLVVLGLCAAVAVATARGVTGPINRLVSVAKRIEKGEYSQEIVIDRGDEIGVLASALNTMQKGIAEREAQIFHQAYHDALTGLPNRAMMCEQLECAIGRAEQNGSKSAVILIGLNQFKLINDTLGHSTGDAVLKIIGQRLTNIVRERDSIARLGGDEFLLIMEGADDAGAHDIARRVGAVLAAPVQVGELRPSVSATMGAAICPDHGATADELVRRADIAMYVAKDAHKPIAVYEPGQDEAHLRRLALINELRKAIDADDLQVVYQPKVDTLSGRANGAEALLRWRHPRLGAMSPAEFVPLAERSGNIRALTQWVVRRVVRQLRQWREEGINVTVSVNVSTLDLLDPEFPDFIARCLREQGVDVSKLVLEITESAVMADAEKAIAALHRLAALGLRISIDDFGTGYSSLAQLKRLPVSELKIDKSFVMHMDEDADDEIIVRSTIELAHNMGLKVVAEGVESAGCRALLEKLSCDSLQGFLFSHPLPPEEFGRWASKQAVESDQSAIRKAG